MCQRQLRGSTCRRAAEGLSTPELTDRLIGSTITGVRAGMAELGRLLTQQAGDLEAIAKRLGGAVTRGRSACNSDP